MLFPQLKLLDIFWYISEYQYKLIILNFYEQFIVRNRLFHEQSSTPKASNLRITVLVGFADLYQ